MYPVVLLRILFSGILAFMIFITIKTSLESNLFEEWNFLTSIPWMNATLFDFFANVIALLVLVWYRERSIGIKILWTILFICLGSMATCIYFLIALFQMNKTDSLQKLFSKR